MQLYTFNTISVVRLILLYYKNSNHIIKIFNNIKKYLSVHAKILKYNNYQYKTKIYIKLKGWIKKKFKILSEA